jgi:transglutaminase-like putative cysteine protease
VIYDIRHLTTYDYASAVTFSRCALRLLPVDGPGQRLLQSSLWIDPLPGEMSERTCFFGNRVTFITINAAHRELKIEARSSVEIARAEPPMDDDAPWEGTRDAANAIADLSSGSPSHFLYPSRFVPRFQPAADYALDSFPPGRSTLRGAIDLMRRIRADFRYDPKSTVVSTPLSEAFGKRHGVCQDFAHIMIAGLRGLGLPAAYVSGYLRSIPPEGKPHLVGADASHAWVSVWCGHALGWIGLDPTNAMMIGDDHVVLAMGRDYSDISPVSGIILASGEQSVEVEVDIIPRDGRANG